MVTFLNKMYNLDRLGKECMVLLVYGTLSCLIKSEMLKNTPFYFK